MTALHALAPGVRHPAPLRGIVPGWRILAGLFAAPLAWSLQLLASYGIDGDSCLGASQSAAPVKLVLAAAFCVAALAIALTGLRAAWRVWRITRREAPGDHRDALTAGHGRTRFLGLCGVMTSMIFVVAIAFEGLVPILVSSCAGP